MVTRLLGEVWMTWLRTRFCVSLGLLGSRTSGRIPAQAEATSPRRTAETEMARSGERFRFSTIQSGQKGSFCPVFKSYRSVIRKGK